MLFFCFMAVDDKVEEAVEYNINKGITYNQYNSPVCKRIYKRLSKKLVQNYLSNLGNLDIHKQNRTKRLIKK